MFKVPEQHRVTNGRIPQLNSTPAFGNNGMFVWKMGTNEVRCIASDQMGWEHVSVSLSVKRTPDWEEMCEVKDKFWGKDDAVMQFHPPESEYVNNHAYCLHLWRKCGENQELPPSIFVGDKSKGVLVK